MANHYTHYKGRYICVDVAQAAHSVFATPTGRVSHSLLYTTEMEQGSSDEAQYTHNHEVSCAVCSIM